MIKLQPDPTFTADVRLTVPGQAEPAVVPMTFKYMTAEQVTQWFKDNGAVEKTEAMRALVLGWDEKAVAGPDGTAVPFSADALSALLKNYIPATGEILQAWQTGLSESRIKN